MHFDAGKDGFDFGELPWAKSDVRRPQIFLGPMQLPGSGNGRDPGSLREEPGERDLRRGRALPFRNAFYGVDDRLIGLAILGIEPRAILSVVIRAEGRLLSDRAG